MGLRETAQLRAAVLLSLFIGAAGLTEACGAVLGIDSIEYDVPAEGGSPRVDSSLGTTADGTAIGHADGATTDDSASDETAKDAGQSDGPFIIAQGLGVPKALAVDDVRLYWVDTQGATGSVQSLSKDGTGTVTTIAANQPSPLDIAVDPANVYWSVNQAPPTAGQTQCLAMVATKDGGAPACMSSGAFASIRMTTIASYVLILSQAAANDFIGYPAADGGYQNVQIQGPSLAVTATSQTIYVGNKNGFHVDDLTLAALGFGPIACEANCGTSPVVDLTTDVAEENVLWITQGGGVYALSTSSTSMSGTQIAQLPSALRRMARDASYVYVTAASSVFAVPITATLDAGPPVLTLATGQVSPFGIAVDGRYVYWTSSDGTIRAVSVPAPL